VVVTADAGIPTLADVVTWPQAVVAVVIVFALLMWPSVVTMISSHRTSKRLKNVEAKAEVTAHEVRPNSGKSLADAVNRIESGLAQHLSDATEHNAKVDARLDRLERRGWLARILGL